MKTRQDGPVVADIGDEETDNQAGNGASLRGNALKTLPDPLSQPVLVSEPSQGWNSNSLLGCPDLGETATGHSEGSGRFFGDAGGAAG